MTRVIGYPTCNHVHLTFTDFKTETNRKRYKSLSNVYSLDITFYCQYLSSIGQINIFFSFFEAENACIT